MKKKLFTLLLCALFAFAVAGCKNEGKAEKAGKDIDATYEKTKKEVDDSLDRVKDKIEETQN